MFMTEYLKVAPYGADSRPTSSKSKPAHGEAVKPQRIPKLATNETLPREALRLSGGLLLLPDYSLHISKLLLFFGSGRVHGKATTGRQPLLHHRSLHSCTSSRAVQKRATFPTDLLQSLCGAAQRGACQLHERTRATASTRQSQTR